MSTVFISAGEASGEAYGAQLIHALNKREAALTFFGLGGEQMRAAGAELTVESRSVAVVGLAEVVKHLPGIYGKFKKLLCEIDARKPIVAILVDFPDFNLRLARELHKRRIPVVYFVSPQLWAWRKGRIKQVQKYVTKMLVIFPFEEQFYRDNKVAAEYVGHPLADLPAAADRREVFAAGLALDTSKPWIALLPGSRKQEIGMHLQTIVEAAKLLGKEYEYVLPVASTLSNDWIRAQLPLDGPKITLVDDSRAALHFARASIVASGTATVEAALAGNPFVVVYKVSPLTWTFGRKLVNLEHFAMVNLIANKRIVPELIQHDFMAETIVEEMRKILSEGEARQAMIAALAEVKTKLHPQEAGVTAADRAANAVMQILSQRGN